VLDNQPAHRLLPTDAIRLDEVPMTAVPTATGLFETHLTVSDLDRSIEFYRDVVGLPLALVVEERGAAFFWIGAPGEAMLGLWSLGSAPLGLSLHIALKTSLGHVLAACDGLRASGVTPLSFFAVETSEPSVIGWMPAAAVYFRDPDGHLIEYLAMLDEAPRAERGIVPWSEWASSDRSTGAPRVERYTGARSELRALFEEAEDSSTELDGYIDAGEVLVAIAADGVVGHLQLLDGGADASEIKNMAVAAAYRGGGIGRKLIQGAIDLARAKGHSRLAVATAAADVGNLRFYQLAGFRMRAVERDAFTPAVGYPAGMTVNGIRLRDRVWLDLELSAQHED
jgi:GNAT superfamily N-acetyltransferase/catechol 2,3-dioxygenase-like lactoylglutathione lyase family enzyme